MRKLVAAIILLVIFVAVPLAAQTLPAPWALTTVRPVIADSIVPVSSFLAPSGDLYLAGDSPYFNWPSPSITYGNVSASSAYSMISRYDPAGKLVYTIKLAGATGDGINSIQLYPDSTGNVFAIGNAVPGAFYTTPGAYRPAVSAAPGEVTAFVCKVRADGSLHYCTYLDYKQTNRQATCAGIGGDGAGSFYFSCGPFAQPPPTTPGALNLGNGGYIGKLDPSGSRLVFAASFGTSTYVSSGAVDAAGSVTVAGSTSWPDFPTTPNAAVRGFQLWEWRQSASFVARLNAAGSGFVYSTLGRLNESPRKLALDPAGNAQILTSAYIGGTWNQLLRRYNADGSAVRFEILYPTYGGVAVMGLDTEGVTTLLGVTYAPDFQVLRPTQACRQRTGWSGFLIRLTDSGSLLQSTFLQGTAAPSFYSLVTTPNAITAAAWSAASTNSPHYQLEVLTVGPDAKAQVNLTCAANAASLAVREIAPGDILSLFGEGIGPATPEVAKLGSDQRFPTSLAQTQVTFDGVPAPLLYASDRQINTVSPFALGPRTEICVLLGGLKTNCIVTDVRTIDPGIFVVGSRGSNAVAFNEDGTPNSQQNPAPPGSIVSLYVTGLGAITPSVPDGALVPFPPPSHNVSAVAEIQRSGPYGHWGAWIIMQPLVTEVAFAGAVPFQIAGLSRIGVRLPKALVDGVSYPAPALSIRLTLPDGSTIYSNAVTVWASAPK